MTIDELKKACEADEAKQPPVPPPVMGTTDPIKRRVASPALQAARWRCRRRRGRHLLRR
jgi:hypothetical protein